MKKTAITLLTLAGMATADTIIYNLGNQDTTFGEYTDVHFVQSGGYDSNGYTAEKKVPFNDTEISISFESGHGNSRSFTDDEAANWDTELGLPSGVQLGINSEDIDTLLSSSAMISGSYGSWGEYPGISKLTLRGLSGGWYRLTSFMGRSGGNTTLTEMVFAGADASVVSYVYEDGAWVTADDSTFKHYEAGSAAAMVNVYSFYVDDDVNEVTLTYDGKVTYPRYTETHQNVQFIALESIPEPSTTVMGLLALCGLAARRRR